MVLGKVRNALEPLAITLLRISTGVIMTTHGWTKIINVSGWIENFTNLGIPHPVLAVYLSIAGEFLGGLGLIVGLLTPLAALGVMSTMGVAVLFVHWKNGLMAVHNGFEYPMTLFFVALFFFLHGAGPIGLDALFCRKKVSPSQENFTP